MTLKHNIISRVIAGDDEAIKIVAEHYEDYIDALMYKNSHYLIRVSASNREDIRQNLIEMLQIAILKFEERI